MPKIVHAADLHISKKEKEYSLSVLHEIVDVCRKEKARYLLLAGDVFDSADDYQQLLTEVEQVFAETGPLKTYMIQGNHEELGQKSSSSNTGKGHNLSQTGSIEDSSSTAGTLEICVEKPYSFLALDGIELVFIPFQKSQLDFRSWDIPPKKSYRILVAHGSVAGLSFIGTEEDDDAVIDPEIMDVLDANYGAFGHIHKGSISKTKDRTMVYPGSARVWRKGEQGPRHVSVVDSVSGEVRLEVLKSAGQFRPVDLDINSENFLQQINYAPQDWLNLRLTGILDEQQELDLLESRVIESLKDHVRVVTIDSSQVISSKKLLSSPLVKQFLEALEAKRPKDEKGLAAYRRAKYLGLEEMRRILESRV